MTIIVLKNTGNKGKTATLRELANHIISKYKPKCIFPTSCSISLKDDFRLVVKINNKIIGIESQGDPNTNLEERLQELFTKYHCDSIICSSRTSGGTVNAVIAVASSNNQEVVWSSTYENNTSSSHQSLNIIKAKHIDDLLVSLKLI